ncbi:MAG TPA: glycosyltransferase [Thermoanaerobaculia bacterium]|nr:glycosyltransferase [Thermoanaerobaculia bacterium]
MESDPRLILVVPCFNEEQRLPVDELRNFRIDGVRLEILLVDDGSSDGTLRLLESLSAQDPERFSVLALEQNSGKAEGVRRGIVAAIDRNPDLVGFWDADLATPLSEIPGFLDVFATRPEIDMVFAARVRLLGRSISRNPARHYFGRVGATLISQSLGLAVYDTQCGAKLFRATDDMRTIFRDPFLSRWIFDVEIIARLVRHRGRDAASRAIYELPINAWHDVKGSKVKSTDFGRALKDLWRIHRAYRRE